MNDLNPCIGCIGENDKECCLDVFIVLNPSEIHFFQNFDGFLAVEGGGIFYTENGCPYLNQLQCTIHSEKPLYCKYYPIFITGEPYLDDGCQVHNYYSLTDVKLAEIKALQEKFPVYKPEWTLEDIEKLYNNIVHEEDKLHD